MAFLRYIKVKHFKVFGEEINVDFDQRTVIIGPNNAGKTSVIQALTLWQLAVRKFLDERTELSKYGRKYKGTLKTSTGIGINRFEIDQIPISDTRQLFFRNKVRSGSDPEKIIIKVGILHDGKVLEAGVEFKYHKSEVIYCYLHEGLTKNVELLEVAAGMQINLLYPMSGLEREETVLQEGAIRKLIGKGITAGLLRNICYNLHSNNPNEWGDLVNMMDRLFSIRLEIPKRLSTDDLILGYNYSQKDIKSEKSLGIEQAGRGQLQMLLILSFSIWRKNSIILIDEPDAHLEVLRQNQVLEVLKMMSDKYNTQVIITTHSEVVMNDADADLAFLLDGENIPIKSDYKKTIKSSLRDYGIEHYIKAKIAKSILYLEGTTDRDNLYALAQKFDHKVADLLAQKPFIYYTQAPDENHPDYESLKGYYSNYRGHFQAINSVLPEIRGLCIFDSDGNVKKQQDENGLMIRYWSSYELENYFLYPDVLTNFILSKCGPIWKDQIEIMVGELLNEVFGEDIVLLDLYNSSSNPQKLALFRNQSKNLKMSQVVEKYFNKFNNQYNQNLPAKGQFYTIVEYCEISMIEKEVPLMLDLIYEVLKIEH